jgi:5-hydroxyisourate hydrolase
MMTATPARSAVTSHVLDTTAGRPARGVPVRLEDATDGAVIGRDTTDADGRVTALGPPALSPGSYRVVFDTDAYFAATGTTAFYPEVAVTFRVDDPSAHSHVPLLLSPYGYSTYRGS